jgi:hypothetical protein
MDAAATITALRNAIDERNWPEAVAALNNYYVWRLKGGAAPAGGDAYVDTYAAQLADALTQREG